VRGYASQLPESIASRGGLLMVRYLVPMRMASANRKQPMYQSEALWMSFVGSGACAIKVHAGGINAISGRRAADGPVDEEDQDYVSVPLQPWLGMSACHRCASPMLISSCRRLLHERG
jgi:hypothetical protein